MILFNLYCSLLCPIYIKPDIFFFFLSYARHDDTRQIHQWLTKCAAALAFSRTNAHMMHVTVAWCTVI